jgi:hypothetical protein
MEGSGRELWNGLAWDFVFVLSVPVKSLFLIRGFETHLSGNTLFSLWEKPSAFGGKG